MSIVPIFLLKTPSQPKDRYEEYFTSLSDDSTIYKPIFLNPLTHEPIPSGLSNFDSLLFSGAFAPAISSLQYSSSSSVQLRPQRRKYDGLIFTSQRAVETIAPSILTLQHHEHGYQLLDKSLAIYVVGPATANVVRACFASKRSCESSVVILGQECGNGEALAKFILHDYQKRRQLQDSQSGPVPTLPLLFIAGEKRRDIIPRLLQSADLPAEKRIEVEELPIYRTFDHPNFDILMKEAIKDYLGSEMWIVIFSSSNAEAIFSALEFSANQKKRENVYIATIGSTTKHYLGIEPEVCATSPTPEALSIEIHHYRRQNL